MLTEGAGSAIDEYIRFRKFFGKPVDPNMAVEFNRYILEGGFPRTITIDDETARRTYVTGVISEIFEKDIKRRVKIKDIASFESVRNLRTTELIMARCWRISSIFMLAVSTIPSA